MPFNTTLNTRAGRAVLSLLWVVGRRRRGDRHVTRPTKGLSLSRLARTRSNRPLSQLLSLASLPRVSPSSFELRASS